ncbi:Ubiquitin--protein ligase [Bertholletia excelsa]
MSMLFWSYEMRADLVELPLTMKVHRLMCSELKKHIDNTSQVYSSIESARPRCSSGIQSLCSLLTAMEKARSLISQCSESSKLYLAITGERILLRCLKIREKLEFSLGQIQKEVPPSLATQISRILDGLNVATFVMESSEEEAGKVLLALIHQNIPASESVDMTELRALQLAALLLHITSPVAVVVEKRSLKKLLDKITDTDQNKANILKYLLYLLRKYGKSIRRQQMDSSETQHEMLQSSEPVPHVNNTVEQTQVNLFDALEPPDEFKCPLSARLMYDPVIIASGQTFERMWIEKEFRKGIGTCPRTKMELPDLSITPNYVIKDLISRWCKKQGITIPEPSSQPVSAGSRLQKYLSSSSIASFGTSIDGLHLQIGNMLLGSSDTNYGSDLLDSSNSNGSSNELFQSKSDPSRFQTPISSRGMDLTFLIKLAELPWPSQCMAVKDIKVHLKDDNQGSHSMSSNYVKPLIRFLKDARDLPDLEAQRDGAELLMTILGEIRNEIPPLQDDAMYVLSSFLDSQITEEALSIMEMLSTRRSYDSMILASGVLASILRILEKDIKKHHFLATKILCNLSENSDVGQHMIYLDYIPKLAPFLGDCTLAGYCIKILRNLCNREEEARFAVAESSICMASMKKLLESGTDQEQEVTMDVLLSLYHNGIEYFQPNKQESVIRSLMHICTNGNSKGKLTAAELLKLLGGFGDGRQEVPVPNFGSKFDAPQDPIKCPNQKKAFKVSRLLIRI